MSLCTAALTVGPPRCRPCTTPAPDSTPAADWRRLAAHDAARRSWRRCCCCSAWPTSCSGRRCDDVEDGVLWVQRPTGVVAAEVDPAIAGRRAPVSGPATCCWPSTASPSRRRDDVHALQQRRARGARHTYTLLTLGDARVAQVTLAPIPRGVGGLYYVLAAVGIFTLLVGAAVRMRRPRDQATLHFFWLSVAFFGVFTFSFSGRLDRVDWVFYWADEIAMLLLPPLFLHFTLVFPERPRVPACSATLARAGCRCSTLPAALLGCARALALVRARRRSGALHRRHRAARPRSSRSISPACLHRRPGRPRPRARRASRSITPAPAALDRLGHGARRRPVRARLRAAVRVRRRAVAADGAVGHSARPHAAGVRLGDRALPADGRRSDRQARCWSTPRPLSAIVAIYA